MVNEPMEFKTTTNDPAGDLEVIQSKENDVFYGYLSFLKKKCQEREPFDRVLRDSTATKDEVAAARTGLQKLTDEVTEHCYYSPTILVNSCLGSTYMMNEPEVPEAPESIEDVALWQYLWYRNHYWDRVDFSDPRLVRDGGFDQLVTRYWAKVLPQIPDTMLTEAQAICCNGHWTTTTRTCSSTCCTT